MVHAIAAQNTNMANTARGSRNIDDSNSEWRAKGRSASLNLGIATNCSKQMHQAA
jgi:hypothetical protein